MFPILLHQLLESWTRKYYVDFTLGLDTNDGLSPVSAWKTVAKVNATSFQIGDSILFKRGETWDVSGDAALTIPNDSLYFGTYGSGALPIIDGGDTVNCISGNGKDNLTFDNIFYTDIDDE